MSECLSPISEADEQDTNFEDPASVDRLKQRLVHALLANAADPECSAVARTFAAAWDVQTIIAEYRKNEKLLQWPPASDKQLQEWMVQNHSQGACAHDKQTAAAAALRLEQFMREHMPAAAESDHRPQSGAPTGWQQSLAECFDEELPECWDGDEADTPTYESDNPEEEAAPGQPHEGPTEAKEEEAGPLWPPTERPTAATEEEAGPLWPAPPPPWRQARGPSLAANMEKAELPPPEQAQPTAQCAAKNKDKRADFSAKVRNELASIKNPQARQVKLRTIKLMLADRTWALKAANGMDIDEVCALIEELDRDFAQAPAAAVEGATGSSNEAPATSSSSATAADAPAASNISATAAAAPAASSSSATAADPPAAQHLLPKNMRSHAEQGALDTALGTFDVYQISGAYTKERHLCQIENCRKPGSAFCKHWACKECCQTCPEFELCMRHGPHSQFAPNTKSNCRRRGKAAEQAYKDRRGWR